MIKIKLGIIRHIFFAFLFFTFYFFSSSKMRRTITINLEEDYNENISDDDISNFVKSIASFIAVMFLNRHLDVLIKLISF